MKKLRNTIAIAALLLPGAVQQAYGQFAATGTTTLSVAVAPEAAISVTTGTTSLTTGSTIFGSSYGGTTSFTYKIRTSAATSTLTLEITTDFSTGGVTNKPSVAAPPTASDKLQYTCSVTAPGTGCASATTASTSAATSVATFPATSSSANAGNGGSVTWSLTDDPVYPVGTYTATATFTISAS
jgi:hypothetical protein